MALWPLNRSIKKTVQEDEKLGSREVPSDGTKTVVFRFDFSKKFFEELFTFGFLEKDFFFKTGPSSSSIISVKALRTIKVGKKPKFNIFWVAFAILLYVTHAFKCECNSVFQIHKMRPSKTKLHLIYVSFACKYTLFVQ